uniref:Uncharacterized protein n=1 Tax=Physcomitrium patens TaxID=3218 RepID=A0A2K1L094_PHYPA|nr:hypothetical protein PHYPA_002239 [Physcomitrium patens]
MSGSRVHWLLNSNRSVVPHSVKPCAWTPTLVVSTTRILIFPQRLPTTFNEVRVMSSSKSVHLTKTTPRRANQFYYGENKASFVPWRAD